MSNPKTPMMKQYFDIKNEYKDFILFYRLGDFYEMFYDDAILASRVLEITLTRRAAGGGDDAPLCGVPHHSADNYIARLVKNGYKVAICEQTEDPKFAKGIVKREVVKLITPGTISDLEMCDSNVNSYLSSIVIDYDNLSKNEEIKRSDIVSNEKFGELVPAVFLSYCDVSTGIMYASQVYTLNELLDELSMLKIAEVILMPDTLKGNYNSNDLNNMTFEDVCNVILNHRLLTLVKFFNSSNTTITWRDGAYFALDSAEQRIRRILSLHNLDSIGTSLNERLVSSCGSLFAYIEETQKVNLAHFQGIKLNLSTEYMVLDNFTRSNLELTKPLRRDEKKGSLLWVLDNTDTAMGSRLLKQWIDMPLLDIKAIERRHDYVEFLFDDSILRSYIKKNLSEIYDFERLITKVVFMSANPKDLNALKLSLKNLKEIKALLELSSHKCVVDYLYDFDTLEDIFDMLNIALLDDVPISLKDGDIFRDGYNTQLDEYRDILSHGADFLSKIEEREREKTGIKTLKIGFNKIFGYYIEISKGQVKNAPEGYIRKQTLTTGERYITDELKQIEEKLLGAGELAKALEYEEFINLRNKVLDHAQRIRHMANKIAFLDCICSLSAVAEKNRYIRPSMNTGDSISIVDGRHPVVEMITSEEAFIANDTFMRTSLANSNNAKDEIDNAEFMMIVTGPNMAGKSTYLRQVALICIMAQIGSFVPAKEAKLSIVNRVFTRVGASDDLFSSQSTFMVEMNELASILNNANSKSLIILDEIGRGTSTYDGLSIAWAVVEYIALNLKAKTIFATHYHELTELEGKIEGVANYCISTAQKNDDIVFLRKIIRGGANRSLGIQVAKLAGIHNSIIERAKELLVRLESSDIAKNSLNLTSDIKTDVCKSDDNGIILSSDEYEHMMINEELAKEIRSIDLNDISPREAWKKLEEIQKRLQ